MEGMQAMSYKQVILIVGAGRIGALAARLLADTNDYQVILCDVEANRLSAFERVKNLQTLLFDIQDQAKLIEVIKEYKVTTILSCLPFYCNLILANLAKQMNLNYFDLTEDVQTVQTIRGLATHEQSVFVPGCGLAPGFVNIAANHLMKDFDELETVKLRVGSIPIVTDNALRYALMWSTDGLINQYANPCNAIVNGKAVQLDPLDDVEHIEVDGIVYEAFNTSGGVGTLVETYAHDVKNLNYKTIRYPGHVEKMSFLMNDLRLKDDRKTLRRILDHALPHIDQDVSIIYVAVLGYKKHEFFETVYVNKLYPEQKFDQRWSAIQIATASSACAVIDLVLLSKKKYHGIVLQEHLSFDEFMKNRFGQVFEKSNHVV